jgi:hypothetical protein
MRASLAVNLRCCRIHVARLEHAECLAQHLVLVSRQVDHAVGDDRDRCGRFSTLGPGGSIDVLLSAKRAGPTGKAYGLDMTNEMLALARESRRKAGVANVEWLKGAWSQLNLRISPQFGFKSRCR